MDTTRIAYVTATLGLVTFLSACSTYRPPFPVPDEPGLYVWNGNGHSSSDLQRLDGDPDWEIKHWAERSNLSPSSKFVIRDPVLANDPTPQPDRVELWRVAWVRSEIGGDNLAMPVAGSTWAVAPIEPFYVAVNIVRAPRQPDALMVVPQASLSSGLYDLKLSGSAQAHEARLGILWNSVDRRQYSAINCVDRYVAQSTTYQTCTGQGGASQGNLSQGNLSQGNIGQTALNQSSFGQGNAQQAMSVEGLQIALVDPVRNANGLVVQGIVTNLSQQTRHMPLMQITLQDKTGQELGRRVIQPTVADLGPGKRMNFKTSFRPPTGPAKVNVTFVPYPTAGL